MVEFAKWNGKASKKVLVLKAFDPNENFWEYNEVPEKIMEALFPTDLEHYVGQEMRLEYITVDEWDALTINGNAMMNGCSVRSAKEELLNEIACDQITLDYRKTHINNIIEPEGDAEQYQEEQALSEPIMHQ